MEKMGVVFCLYEKLHLPLSVSDLVSIFRCVFAENRIQFAEIHFALLPAPWMWVYCNAHLWTERSRGGRAGGEEERGRDRHCLLPRCQDYRNEPPHPLFFGSDATAAVHNCQVQSTRLSPGSSVCLLNVEATVKVWGKEIFKGTLIVILLGALTSLRATELQENSRRLDQLCPIHKNFLRMWGEVPES